MSRKQRASLQGVGVVAIMVTALVASTVSAGASPTGHGHSGATRDYFSYPDAALVRPLGDIPAGPCGAADCNGSSPGQRTIPNLAGLGVPLGGVGAGSFMVNQAGTFGPWNFGGSQYSTGEWQNRILPQAAFHVREQVGGSAATVTTLATKGPHNTGPAASRNWGDPLPAWNLLDKGQGTYAALYPFGWTTYNTFQTDISMRFYSPIVAGEDRRTSLPLAYFDIRIANRTGKTAKVSTMFTMPNVAESVDGAAPTVRAGLSDSVSTDRRTGVTSVTLGSDSSANTPDAYKSEWTIAAKPNAGQTVSYVPSWNAGGDGSDIYSAFSRTGVLGDTSLDGSQSAGAIAVSATLRPGQVTVVPFALAWDFPQVTSDNNQTVWMRRYTQFYGARTTDQADASPGDYNRYIAGSYPFHRSQQIADDALASEDDALTAVQRWWAPIANDRKVPSVLRTAALNQLGQVAFKTSLWAAGFVSSTASPTLGLRLGSQTPGTHVYFSPDSLTGGNTAMGSDVDAYGYLAYDRFFPSIERDRLSALAEGIVADPSGNPADPTSADPYIEWQPGAPPVPGAANFLDDPSKRIYRMYAYAELNHDPAFLRQMYPAMKKELGWLQGTIPAGASLPVGAQPPGATFLGLPNTFDIVAVQGADEYDSMLYLLSLEIMIESGRHVGELPSVVREWRSELAHAKAQFESTFWDSQNQWYRYTEYSSGSAVLLDTFHAQHVAEQLGLPDLVDPSHYRTQLAGTFGTFMSHRDADGDPLGAYNVALPAGVTQYPLLAAAEYPILALIDGGIAPVQEEEVWTGANFFVGATYIDAGKRFNSPQLRNDGISMASAVANQIWTKADNGFAFDAPEAWDISNGAVDYLYAAYERPLAVWDTVNALSPLFPRGER